MSNINQTRIEMAERVLTECRGCELRWACALIEMVILVLSTPLIFRKRHKPIVYLRCWTILIASVTSIVIYKSFDAIRSSPYMVTASNYPYVWITGSIFLIPTLSSFHSIFLRHHFLLQVPKMQQLIVATNPADYAQYQMLTKKYRRIRFWSSEKAAWITWAIHTCFLLAVSFSFIGTYDRIGAILGESNMYNSVRSMILAFESVTAIICLLVLIPAKPMDNYNISIQMQVLTFLTGIVLTISTVIAFSPDSYFMRQLELVNDTIFPLLIVTISLLVPIWPEEWTRFFRRQDNEYSHSSFSLSMTQTNVAKTTAGVLGSPSVPGESLSPEQQHLMMELDITLTSPIRLTELQAFMAKEFCLENLLFILSVMEYRTQATVDAPAVTIARANDIVRGFILAESLNRVYLPIDCVKRTREAVLCMTVDQAETDLFGHEFDEADSFVRHVIITDTLPRMRQMIPGFGKHHPSSASVLPGAVAVTVRQSSAPAAQNSQHHSNHKYQANGYLSPHPGGGISSN